MFAPIAVALALVTAPLSPATQTLIDLNTQARGGETAIEAVESVEIHLTINEGWQAQAVYRATRSGDMRIDVFIDGERVFSEGLHDGDAWAMAQGAKAGTPATPEEAEILWRGVLGNVYGLHELQAEGVSLTAGHDPESGADTLELVYSDGFETRLYFDPQTHLATEQRSDHALHPAADPTVRRFTSRYSDFREVNGVVYAFVQEKYDLDTGERVQLTEVQSIEANVRFDPALFEMPQ